MLTNKLMGMGIALITPFKKDGSVDFDALERLVEYQIENGTDYLVILGTTAETPTLTEEEKDEIARVVIAKTNKRLPIVMGIGGNNTRTVVEKIKATDLSQVDAVLSVVPYYNKPSQEGIYQHYKAIAQATSTPIVLYNVPGRTGVNMKAETILRLANEFSNIVGIKEAAGDLVQAMKIIQHKPKDFLVISGDDMIALPMVLAGGAGVISVIGQGFPKEFSEMIRLGLNKKVDAAFEIQYKIADSIDMIFEQGNPAGIKEIFKTLKKIRSKICFMFSFPLLSFLLNFHC